MCTKKTACILNTILELCQMNDLTFYGKVWHWHVEFSQGDLILMTSCGVYLAVSAAACVSHCGVLMGAEP